MKSNRTHPQQRLFQANLIEPSASLDQDCCGECCNRRTICVSIIFLIGFVLTVVGVVLALMFGIPKRPPVNRQCRTKENGTGFLCDDKVTCILPSELCNGIMNCQSGADEETDMCNNLPTSLPGYLVFRCGNSRNWIFVNRKCDHINDCGDCSDEIGTFASCPPSCGDGWWSCTPVEFQFCSCIPRSLCRDGRQNCHDWSDEYICPKIS